MHFESLTYCILKLTTRNLPANDPWTQQNSFRHGRKEHVTEITTTMPKNGIKMVTMKYLN